MLTQGVVGTHLASGSKDKVILSWKEIHERLKDALVLPTPVNLHLIRHAESRINADKRVTGSQDVELTAKGEEEASVLGEKLFKHYDLAFASGLKRSQKTLEIALNSGNINTEKILLDCRLNERGLGVLEGQKSRWIPEYAYGDLNYAPERGESYAEVARRVLSFLIELATYSVDNPTDAILISGHMGPMRIMVGIITEKEDPVTVLGLTFSNTEVVKLRWNHLKFPEFLKNI